MALPPELLDHILSFLKSDPETLKTCSETHPLLCQLAEPYLYSYLRVETTPNNSPLQRFKPADVTELLSKRPHIVHYIRSLEIYVSGNYGNYDRETRRCGLEEISTVLPNLVALREITLDHSPSPGLGWEAQPESFRRAFLDCLRSQFMQDVHIKHVFGFPFMSVLNGRCKYIRSLSVRGGLWQYSNPSPIKELNLDGPFTNQGLPLQSLCIQLCREGFLEGFVPWFTTCRSQLRSLEFAPLDDRGYGSLSKLLTSSSNSLTSLDLDLGFARARMSSLDVCNHIHTFCRLLWLQRSFCCPRRNRKYSSYTFHPPTSRAADYPCCPLLPSHCGAVGILLPHPGDHTIVPYQHTISRTFNPLLRLYYRKPQIGSNEVSSLVVAFRSHLYTSRPPFINYICIRVPKFHRCACPSWPPPWWSTYHLFIKSTWTCAQGDTPTHHSFSSFRLEGIDAVCGAG